MEKCSVKRCLPGVFFTIFILISDKGVRTDVNFKSKPTTIKTFENDTVLLPCYSTESHRFVRWIDHESKTIVDSRYPNLHVHNRVLYPNGSLEVANIMLNDTGDYNCEVGIGNRIIKQFNSIEVQLPAEALAFPSGEMNVTLGAIFQITCEVKGVPFPYITWLHNNRPVTNTYPDDERRLLVEVKHYDMAGPIKCVAKNGVGEEPAVDGVTLIVHFIPDIKIASPIVHTKPGNQAKLECIVFSHPTAQVHWFFNESPIRRTNLITMQDVDLTASEFSPSYYSKKRHSLLIRNVRDSDLGQYECKAENVHGMQNGFITLMGKPMKPSFDNATSPSTPTSKILNWQTESLSPIIDYKLRFRQIPSGNVQIPNHAARMMWNELTVPADNDQTGPFHTKSYKLDGLQPREVYEVLIQSRNCYGFSDSSKILRFATPSETNINDSSTESNENHPRYDDDLIASNEVYHHPSAFNTGAQLMVNMLCSVAFIALFSLSLLACK